MTSLPHRESKSVKGRKGGGVGGKKDSLWDSVGDLHEGFARQTFSFDPYYL